MGEWGATIFQLDTNHPQAFMLLYMNKYYTCAEDSDKDKSGDTLQANPKQMMAHLYM